MISEVRPQAVVFDLDGLMFNSEDLYDRVSEQLLGRRGRSLTPELKRKMMGVSELCSMQMMIDQHQFTDTAEALLEESDAILDRLLPGDLAPMPGLMGLLDALEFAGLAKAIATSSRRPFVTRVLDHFDLRPRFHFLLTAEDVTRAKPHPEIYRKAAARFALAPRRILVLEDSENGCRAATTAGAWTVAVPSHHTIDHEFSGVQLIADSLADPRLYRALGLASVHVEEPKIHETDYRHPGSSR